MRASVMGSFVMRSSMLGLALFAGAAVRAESAAHAQAQRMDALRSAQQREVLALRRALRRGEAIACGDTQVVRRAAYSTPSGALDACSWDQGAVALRPLGAGDLLRSVDVGLAPPVAARADVRLRVRVGPITIERSGTALADAQVGERVLVRLAGSAQAVRGVVVGHDDVEIRE